MLTMRDRIAALTANTIDESQMPQRFGGAVAFDGNMGDTGLRLGQGATDKPDLIARPSLG